jgi:hypothetical protein
MPAAAVTIDHNTLTRLVEANAVRNTHIVARPGGWGVIVRYGAIESSLAATRSKETRVFKRLETAGFDATAAKTYSRPDTSATLKQAHAALAHDRWFRDQVGAALQEADDPSTQWVSNEAAMSEGAKRRESWRARGASPFSGKGSPA